jgi:hypothetical protein
VTEIKITRYRPGRAAGAGDLQTWASRRLVGQSGLKKKAEKKWSKAVSKWKKSKRQQRRQRKAQSLLNPVATESQLIKAKIEDAS